ncbi:MAG: dockerin type I repeat-containing protein [Armatimonadetes bacterium]|nr:dockerin type I repeat-containing protein [Armatimonadota bacterium]
MGDLTGDSLIDIRDAVLSLQFAIQVKAPTEAQKVAGDVKKDGALNVEDSVLILQHIVFGAPLE